MIDADNELFTSINVYATGGNESASALTLLEQEMSAHHNTIEQLSIDGVGYDGPVLRALESEEGPHVEVFVPPKTQTNQGKFTTEDFTWNDDASKATCLAGEQSEFKERDNTLAATAYRFKRETCQSCPLINRCIDPEQKRGRTVYRSDYTVERRLGELINRHGCRRARYRGRAKVFVQQLIGALTANVNRMIRLLDISTAFGR